MHGARIIHETLQQHARLVPVPLHRSFRHLPQFRDFAAGEAAEEFQIDALGEPHGLDDYGYLLGYAAHALTDVNDSVGTLLLFPFSTLNWSVRTWAYAATVQGGKYLDAAAYYSSQP